MTVFSHFEKTYATIKYTKDKLEAYFLFCVRVHKAFIKRFVSPVYCGNDIWLGVMRNFVSKKYKNHNIYHHHYHIYIYIFQIMDLEYFLISQISKSKKSYLIKFSHFWIWIFPFFIFRTLKWIYCSILLLFYVA